MHDVSVEQEVTSKPPTIRRRANDASEARFLTREMHQRIPAWKLKADFSPEKESTDVGQAPQGPEKEPEGAAEAPGAQSAEDKSHHKTGKQCATAQSSNQPTSSTAAPTQDATASLGKATPEHDDDEDEADEVARHDWATRFLTGDQFHQRVLLSSPD